jgi:photosystem II stability/assembly factor-like uncharacterized protein
MKITAIIFFFLFVPFISYSQWSQQVTNTTNHLSDVHFLNDSVGFVVGNNGTFLKTNDRGQIWNKTVINSADDLQAVFALNELTILAGGDILYKSIDGGLSWNSIPNPFNVQDIKFFSPQVGFIKSKWLDECFEFPNVTITLMKYFSTTDGGNTWENYNQLPDNFTTGEIDVVSADTGYIVAEMESWDYSGGPCQTISYSRFYKTADGGLSWQQIYDGIGTGSYLGASFLDGWEGFIVKKLDYDYEPRLYKMNGGGSDFVFVADIAENTIGNLVFATLYEGYYNSAGKIMKTTSGGILWEEDYNGPTTISKMVITKNNEGYAIGNSGLILHKKINPSNEPLKYLNIDETSLTFPKTNITEESYQSFTITASGNADITIGISAPSNFFVKPENSEDFVSQISGLIIPAQHDTTILVAFAPGTNQFFQYSLTITSDALNNPLIIMPVEGKGIYILPQIISNDTSYCADSVWLRNSLTIDQGSSLTFCPGITVVVPFLTTSDPDIVINGSLYAIGTLQDSIRFVVDRTGQKWDGIDINGDNSYDSVFIDYCVIENTYKDIYNYEDNGGAIGVFGNKSVSILHTTIRQCRSNDHGGGIYCSGSNCRIEACDIRSCVSKHGGGIYLDGNPGHAITNCNIIQCSAPFGGGGGGICYQSGDGLQILNCTISECGAKYGGGLYLAGNNYEVQSTPVNECAANYGGGLYLSGSGPSLVENVKIQYCTADEGGGIYIDSGSGISIVNCVISGCDSELYGGGIADQTGSGLIVKNCTINNNLVHDGNGGGIWISGDSPLIAGNDIHTNNAFNFNNTSAGKGGGIYGLNASPHITDNLLHNNHSDGVGACIFLEKNLNGLTTEIKQNLIYGNMAYYMNNGGGIYISQSKCDIFLNTLTTNTGGGIYCDQPDSTRIYGNIIYNNSPGDLISTDYTIDVSFCDISSGWSGSGSGNIYADPLFYGLLNYPYYWDKVEYSVKPESPCIDAGIPDTTGLGLPALDLVGNPRFASERLDIGAYENNFIYQTNDTGFCQGEDFTLEVIPDYEGAYQAQWSFNGEMIEGAENNSLLIDNPGPEKAGYYNCTLDFAEFPLFSRYIYLYNKGFAPEIQVQPVGAILNPGDGYSLELFAYSIDYYTLYQWYRNDTLLDGANHSWLDITDFSKKDVGTYKCWVENTCGGIFSNDAVLQLVYSGIDELDQEHLVVWPNPASALLTVGQLGSWTVGKSAVSGQRSAVRCEIYDVFGRKLMSFEEISSFPFNIDISSLSPGMHILRIEGFDGISGSLKFMKVAE